jgi:adenine phosphoribosyltransferase
MTNAMAMDLKTFIRDVADFPKKGIIFKDITPLLSNPQAFEATIQLLARAADNLKIAKVAAIESRGFIFGAPLARALGVGFVPVRKKGKLPYKTLSASYQLEYGEDVLEMHADAVGRGENILIVDDVLATGGTARAVTQLIHQAGANVGALAFVIELGFLKGREKIQGFPLTSLIQY